MPESHFQRVASDIVTEIGVLQNGPGAMTHTQVNLQICAMIGLARTTDCPREYDTLASNLWPDGVWGEHTQAAYDFLKNK